MQIYFFIAKRYTKKYGKKTLVYRLSRLTCYSTALGTAILVLVLSTMNGVEKLYSSLFYAYTSALKIESKTGKTFSSNTKLKASITEVPGVTDIVEILEETSLIRYNGQQAIVTIKGVSDNFTQSDFYRNCRRIDATTFTRLKEGKQQAIMGINVRRLLQLKSSNHTIEVFYPQKNSLNHSLGKPYKREVLEVSGLFSIAHTIDSKYIITPINFVERLTNCLHKRTHWEVVIKDGANITKTQADIQKLLPKELKVSNRYEQNAAKRNAIYIERLSVYFIFTLVLLLASLHIFFMLCMLILEKKKDIALLASLGATPNQIGKLFFYNGLLVSLEGILYGLIIAVAVGFLQQKFGLITLTKLSRTGSDTYPIAMQSSDYLYTAMATLFFGTFASLWPAKQAAKLANKEKE